MAGLEISLPFCLFPTVIVDCKINLLLQVSRFSPQKSLIQFSNNKGRPSILLTLFPAVKSSRQLKLNITILGGDGATSRGPGRFLTDDKMRESLGG